MKLLERGAVVPDIWRHVAEGEELGAGAVIVPFSRLDEALATGGIERPGVLITAEQEVSVLRPVLERLALVAVRFPIFRDGRPFTQARALREYEHFRGVIRAEGHILPDQYEFLLRCGVDSVALPDAADEAPWLRAVERFHVAYQAAERSAPLLGPGLRRSLRG